MSTFARIGRKIGRRTTLAVAGGVAVIAVSIAVAVTAVADDGSAQPASTSVSTPAATPTPAPASGPTARHGDDRDTDDGATGCCQPGMGMGDK
jgi:hypothetical protein